MLPSSVASWALLGLVLRPACLSRGQEGAAELGRSGEKREWWDCCGLASVPRACAGSRHGSGEHQAVGLAAEGRSVTCDRAKVLGSWLQFVALATSGLIPLAFWALERVSGSLSMDEDVQHFLFNWRVSFPCSVMGFFSSCS